MKKILLLTGLFIAPIYASEKPLKVDAEVLDTKVVQFYEKPPMSKSSDILYSVKNQDARGFNVGAYTCNCITIEQTPEHVTMDVTISIKNVPLSSQRITTKWNVPCIAATLQRGEITPATTTRVFYECFITPLKD